MSVRVYQLSKELNITSKELIEILKKLNISVTSHMSSVKDEDVEKVKAELKLKPEEIEIEKAEIKPPTEEIEEKPKKEEKPEEEKLKEEKKPKEEEKVQKKVVSLPSTITIRDLSKKVNISVAKILKELIGIGLIANINQSISFSVAEQILDKCGFLAEKEEEVEVEVEKDEEEGEFNFVSRPPVVTVMGHVDHGKTKLLDAIRSTSIAEKEAGGITQHIGAYSVDYNGKKIVFLDTPGHEAFTAMRARGAKVTDIVVLVVAADDGVMPQTVEAIHHAQAAGVPIIVAINKIDKQNADIERVKRQLLDYNLVPEEWGGDTIVVPISAKLKQGLDELLEMILLQAEMLDLKSTQDGMAQGVVIEAKMDQRRGPVSTFLVERGTLSVGKIVVAGHTFGKIKAIVDYKGEKIINATPSMPVEVIGLNGVPFPGEKFKEVKDEKTARSIAEKLLLQMKKEKQEKSHITLTSLYQHIKDGKIKELNIILKTDVQGSLEAIKQSLERIEQEEVIIKIIHSGVGGITENDVMLAVASNALIIGFNVRPTLPALKLAETEKVDIKTYNIIYYLIEDIKAAMKGMLDPKYEEEIIGRGEIRKIFKIPKVGVVAGCYIQEGVFSRSAKARVLRQNVVIYEGEIASLKRFKDDVKDVPQGYECGFGLHNFQDIKVNDIIEVFLQKEVRR